MIVSIYESIVDYLKKRLDVNKRRHKRFEKQKKE